MCSYLRTHALGGVEWKVITASLIHCWMSMSVRGEWEQVLIIQSSSCSAVSCAECKLTNGIIDEKDQKTMILLTR